MKKCSTFLAIKGNANQTTPRLHFTPVRMATTIKKANNKCWWKGTLIHCWWECKLVQILWKSVWKFLKELKIDLPYDPAIPLLGIAYRYLAYRYLDCMLSTRGVIEEVKLIGVIVCMYGNIIIEALYITNICQ
jgi:hypothetical protein